MKVSPVSTADFQPQSQQQQGANQSAFTNEDKHRELAREINMRQQVYPGQIRAGRLTQDAADRQIGILREIWNEYGERAKADKERRAPQLALGASQGGERQSAQDSDAPIDTVTGQPVAQSAGVSGSQPEPSQQQPQDGEQQPGGEPKPIGEPKPAEKPAQPASPERVPATASAAAGKPPARK
jgi:hypothetical protein